MRFSPKHPSTVRQAIARLRLDDGLSGPEIARKLAAGEVQGVDPVEVPGATVYYIAAAERDRRQARIDNELAKTPDGQAVVTHRRSREMLERERHRLEREAAKTGKLDLVGMQKLTAAQANLNRVHPPTPVVQAPEPQPQPRFSLDERLAQVSAEQAARKQEANQAPAKDAAPPEEVPPPKKRSLSDLHGDRTPAGRRAYAERLRELGMTEAAIEILLNTPPEG